MNLWRLLGKAILTGVDALGAGALAGLIGFFAVPVVAVGTRLELALTTGGVVAGVTLAVGLALLGLGRRPFPATRVARYAFDRLPWWI